MPRKSRWARLPFGLRMAVGTSAILVLVGGGAVGIAALTRDDPRVVTATGRDSATTAAATTAPVPPAAPGTLVREPAARHKGLGDAIALDRGRTSDEADRSATRAPRTIGADRTAFGQQAPPATVSDPKPPVTGATAPAATTTQTVDETRAIPYQTQLVRDPSLPRGTRRTQTDGIPGVETLRYLVTYAGGQETGRELLGSTVTQEPQDRVIVLGGGGPGRGNRPRECGPVLGACLPLGRSACPSGEPVPESGSVQLDGSVTLLGDDPNDLGLDAGLVC